MTTRPATRADLRSFAWHELRHDLDWPDRVRVLRDLATLDAAEAGDERAQARLARRLVGLYVETREDGRLRLRWLEPEVTS